MNRGRSEELPTRAPPAFPATRYQGSKRRLLPWLRAAFTSLTFDTALDAFGGTGAVAHLLKGLGKEVTFNDVLRFNWHIGVALVENSTQQVTESQLDALLHAHAGRRYDNVIARTFRDTYYLPEEDAWLDRVAQNTLAMEDPHLQSLALWALFQACMVKRPYNLFHRKNLYVRTAAVERSFGNKVTWDRDFEDHWRTFVRQGNAAVFCNGRRNRALCADAVAVEPGYDLVYVDPPYVPREGSLTDYAGFYHFLEGLVDYGNWAQRIDEQSRHKRLLPTYSPWSDRAAIKDALDKLLAHHRRSQLVVSYREDGVPSIEEIERSLRRLGKSVSVSTLPVSYALSTKRNTREVLLVAT